jgi:putative transposase
MCIETQNCLFSIPAVENILKEEWKHLPSHFAGITPDLIVTMPDHLHCIIWHHGRGETTKNIIDIIGGYKSICSNVWRDYVQATNANYQGRFWQRNFYDHVIRNEKDLENQRKYMLNNPNKAMIKQGIEIVKDACEYNSCGHIPFPPE